MCNINKRGKFLMRILIPIGCRSDEGISKPIIKRLNNNDWCNILPYQLAPANFIESYNETLEEIRIFKPNCIFITGDRIEMTAAACAAFHKNIPIIHYGSGIVNTPISTFDDINRHCISLWADIALCEDMGSANKVGMLWLNIEKITPIHADWGIDKPNVLFQLEERNIYIVGITHLDDLEIDESLVPKEPYDLVLYNPTTKYAECPIIHLDRDIIVIGPNADPWLTEWHLKSNYDNLPRPQFLGLLKNCERYITNSSSAYYERSIMKEGSEIVMMGDRNKNRSTPTDLKGGASDKIIKIIKEWWLKKNE